MSEIVELMARGGAAGERERSMQGYTDRGAFIGGVWVNELHWAFVRGALSALDAHGYEIRKKDGGMVRIKEVEHG